MGTTENFNELHKNPFPIGELDERIVELKAMLKDKPYWMKEAEWEAEKAFREGKPLDTKEAQRLQNYMDGVEAGPERKRGTNFTPKKKKRKR